MYYRICAFPRILRPAGSPTSIRISISLSLITTDVRSSIFVLDDR